MGPSRLLLALLISVPSRALLETANSPETVDRPEGVPSIVRSDGWSLSEQNWFLQTFVASYGGCGHDTELKVSPADWMTCLEEKIKEGKPGLPGRKTGVVLSQNTDGWMSHALPCEESLTANWGEVTMITCTQKKR
mmetsp:Transcript_1099/g.2804  ORF Transcript_1099/g.2804 Transcript_1099/m.2804 type:complete len:136 (-) Transcript_1099:59-466(-)